MTPEPLCLTPVPPGTLVGQVVLQDAAQFALRAATGEPGYLDGVFATRHLTLAPTTRPPFYGTRWKLVAAATAPGAWVLACQRDPAFSLLGLDGAPLLGRATGSAPPAPQMQWLLFCHDGGLLLRSASGDWLGRRDGAPVTARPDDLADPDFHWIPETYW